MLEGCFLTAFGSLGIFTVIFIYPLSLQLFCRRNPARAPSDPAVWPTVTIITAARNAATLLPAKIQNFLELNYPSECLTLLVASDASTDATAELIAATCNPRIRLVEQQERKGKASVMNLAVSEADSDLLLFSDADAILSPNSVRKLARHFADPKVGGVCGQRASARSAARLRDAQQTYIQLDSALKQIESARGRISSNDGKIHMIRRRLFSPIPPDVTDDLYTALSVISQGNSFLFEPEAVAEVNVPSRNARHEVQRRRRIVTRSLTGIFRMRRVLNPTRFGWFSVGLLINKVGRRLLPFFLLILAAGLLQMIWSSLYAVLIGLGLVAGLFAVAVYWRVAIRLRSPRLLKPVALAQYMWAGFVGSGWGVIDFLMGRRVSVWEPKKTEAEGS